ncbi:TetR/AcrR family transcriptional regulator [Rathayibacter rathayi]|uniref:TetR/AcrR family transcriptional regulator n=1 Tax=Rathayibacter rathayi TaxID=33887 RepID=A0ABD6W9H0_RATRA|nr:TetR/AcrR family transcriptional regulator [Rathayibacter rathayi]AZZ48537.1 TetR/AcrR family transcriptional regulator [Rathayibacter rathayi]MWV74848.1 TetR/AcrR family transcriptional regulator [Rathayibacter rathayi NCPPB 2980 = VKM Ac-1601]PPF14739.1 TetR/AcrR family transcriptional regulator [Rathayibacter rathayi]PPF49969.1 TetR/AcrR family transcriptional regulator [Rathayibacter rathayi]PPF80535.1 TetR/AcrR family transcriptional regulator [Rathayibacter rathayi]
MALHRAIIALATGRDVATLTVSEITGLAGVNRSTFYAHASSAAELLCAALRDELDLIREGYLQQLRSGAATDASIREATACVLRHLDGHCDLYLRAFDAPSGDSGLRAMLADHFRTAVSATLDTGVLDVPAVNTPLGFLENATASFLAAGSVGLMEQWLRLPAPRDPDVYLGAYRQLLPPWWPFATSH